MSLKYYVIDSETTGLSTSIHEVVEISIIRCDDRVQLTEFIRAEHPESASWDALKITNKTLADLEKGASKEEVVDKVEKFLNEDGLTSAHRCMIAHNSSFDRRFIHALWEKTDKAFPASLWLDSIAMVKEYLKKTDNSTLNITKTATGKVSTTLHASCDLVGIKKIAQIHASKADTRNTYLLWQKLMELGIDHLPLIKTFEHNYNKPDDVDALLAALDND